MQALHAGADTHPGRRPKNEDAYCIDPECGLFAVADGMGGEEGGEVASRIAVEIVHQFFHVHRDDAETTWPFPPDPGRSDVEYKVDIAVRLADRAVKSQREGRLAKMGATLVVAAFDDDELVIGHLGDSRVYRLRDGAFDQLTRDHSMYNKFRDAGATLPPREEFPYNNVLTRALGYTDGDHGASPDLQRVRLKRGDRYLLCTDGLTCAVPETRMLELLGERHVDVAPTFLVREAYEQGSSDNITAVAVAVDDETADQVSHERDTPTQKLPRAGSSAT